jgi:glutamine synthetase
MQNFKALGIRVKYHHHETGERKAGNKTYFEPLLKTADNVVTVKYALFNLAKQTT